MSTETRIPEGHEGGLSSARRTASFAYAAGVTGMLANLFLIVFYALQVSHPEDGTSLGSANDLLGSLGTAFMIPVALALGALLPERPLMWIIQVLGLFAMAVLTVGGPLLVSGAVAFEVQAPIMVAAWMVLCLWLFLINRWLRSSATVQQRVARLGEFLGAVVLVELRSSGSGSCCPGCRGCSWWRSASAEFSG